MLRVAASVPDWGCSHYRSRADGLDRPCTEAWRCGPDPRLRLVSVSYTAFNHAAETRMVLTVFPRRAALSGRVFLSGAKDSSAVGPLSTSAFPSPTTTIAERGKRARSPAESSSLILPFCEPIPARTPNHARPLRAPTYPPRSARHHWQRHLQPSSLARRLPVRGLSGGHPDGVQDMQPEMGPGLAC